MAMRMQSAKAKLTRAKNSLESSIKDGSKALTPTATPQGNEVEILQCFEKRKLLVGGKLKTLREERALLEEAINNFTETYDKLTESRQEEAKADCEQRLQSSWDTMADADSLIKLMSEAMYGVTQTIESLIIKQERRSNQAQEGSQNRQSLQTQIESCHQSLALSQLLPRLQVPKFTGKRNQWDSFWTLFKTNIHDQPLATMVKYNYLLNALQGEPREAMNRFQISEDNYIEAINWLQQRYGKDALIVDELYKRLEDCQQPNTSTSSQRNLLDEIATIIIQLKNKGQDMDHRWVLNLIFRKFKPAIQTKLLSKRAKLPSLEEWTWDQFYETVDSILNKEEELERAQTALMKQAPMKSLLYQETQRRPCIYCKRKNHQSSECRQVPMEERRSFLTNNKLCLNCGKPNHIAQECRRPGCFKCGRKHHPSICDPQNKETGDLKRSGPLKEEIRRSYTLEKPKQFHSNYKESGAMAKVRHKMDAGHASSVKEVVNDEDNADDNTDYVGHLSDKTLTKPKATILTGIAKILNQDGAKEIRVLFDTGSELSFIDSDLHERLNLPVIGKEILKIRTFGTNNSSTGEYPVTEIQLEDQFGKIHTMTLYVSSMIATQCRKPKLSPDDWEFIKEKGIEIAETDAADTYCPGILLGCDQLWTLVEGVKHQLPSGMHLISTKFGYVLSGVQRESGPSEVPQVMLTTANDLDTWDNYWKMESEGIQEYKGPQKTEKELLWTPQKEPEVNSVNRIDNDEASYSWPLERFSTMTKAVRTMAYVRRFLAKTIRNLGIETRLRLRDGILRLNENNDQRGVTGPEMYDSRLALLRLHQREMGEALKTCNTRNLNVKESNLDGLLRCYGRLGKSVLPWDTKNPVLIAPNTALASLIISEAHGNLHCAIAHTMAKVREKYWIPKLRQQTKKLVKRCVKCQRYNNLPYRYPNTTDLPERRVNKAKPFQHIGLDYFGPLWISYMSGDKRKTYGCIFTCTTTRLIHLELVNDVTTTSFINALRRFMSRRGIPDSITCDNAPTFALGEEILNNTVTSMAEQENIHRFMATREISWSKITPYAPWQGGFYERLIQSVKRSLYKSIGLKLLSEDDLRTVLTEIEASLNTRPLTYIETEKEEIPIIRPIDFIQKDMIITRECEVTTEDDDDSYLPPDERAQLKTRLQAEKALQTSIQITEKFWDIWQKNYLTALRETHRTQIGTGRTSTKTPKEGEVVLVMDPLQSRNNWKLGRITKIVGPTQTEVREVELQGPNGIKFKRPPNLLIPLELSLNDPVQPKSPPAPELQTPSPVIQGQQPTPTHRISPPSPSPLPKNSRLRPRKPPKYRYDPSEYEIYLVNCIQAVQINEQKFKQSWGGDPSTEGKEADDTTQQMRFFRDTQMEDATEERPEKPGEERLDRILEMQDRILRNVVHLQELTEGPICGPGYEDVTPAPITLVNYAIKKVTEQYEDVKKDIAEVRHKQEELDHKLDILVSAQFRSNRMIEELKESMGPTRDEDLLIIPDELIEVDDSEERPHHQDEPVEQDEDTPSTSHARSSSQRSLRTRKRKHGRSPCPTESQRKVLMTNETRLAMDRLAFMQKCRPRTYGNSLSTLRDRDGHRVRCALCEAAGLHRSDRPGVQNGGFTHQDSTAEATL
ncbi:integrase core domain protein [Oesophagostomum dentatum]|uniref:Integrase core domain protein n=1 Tax=Oesophagostomum dentatum TaxID=61180 RepID=A0A0B1SQA8_OESDE|nr:integrase core domain protein [Oesophagostomum dentatum]